MSAAASAGARGNTSRARRPNKHKLHSWCLAFVGVPGPSLIRAWRLAWRRRHMWDRDKKERTSHPRREVSGTIRVEAEGTAPLRPTNTFASSQEPGRQEGTGTLALWALLGEPSPGGVGTPPSSRRAPVTFAPVWSVQQGARGEGLQCYNM